MDRQEERQGRMKQPANILTALAYIMFLVLSLVDLYKKHKGGKKK